MRVRRRRAVVVWGGLLAFGLATALGQPAAATERRSDSALERRLKRDVDALQDAVRALRAQVRALRGKVADSSALPARVEELEAQVTALEAGTAAGLAALQGQLASGLAALQGQLDTLSQQVAALQEQVGGAPAPPGRFVDNGDGTVTDTQTGLTWEQKVAGGGCLNCVNDTYSWAAAVGDWIDRLNGRLAASPSQLPFAGYTDWRLPTAAELQTILLAPFPCPVPCIDPVFGPTATAGYWTSSTVAGGPSSAWDVFFSNGFVNFNPKTTGLAVRAVRGGRP
jgi:polyhydroxyalkanoate synthesis regulator phasin